MAVQGLLREGSPNECGEKELRNLRSYLVPKRVETSPQVTLEEQMRVYEDSAREREETVEGAERQK